MGSTSWPMRSPRSSTSWPTPASASGGLSCEAMPADQGEPRSAGTQTNLTIWRANMTDIITGQCDGCGRRAVVIESGGRVLSPCAPALITPAASPRLSRASALNADRCRRASTAWNAPRHGRPAPHRSPPDGLAY